VTRGAGALPLDGTLRHAVLQRALAGTHAEVKARGGKLKAGAVATKVLTLTIKRSDYDQVLTALERYESEEHKAAKPRRWFLDELDRIDRLCDSWMDGHLQHCVAPGGDPAEIQRKEALQLVGRRVARERALLLDREGFDAAARGGVAADPALDTRPFLPPRTPIAKANMNTKTFEPASLDSGGYVSDRQPVETKQGARLALELGSDTYLIDPKDVERDAYVAARGPLFAHKPCADDVKQGRIGDCYLMAALAAVAERRPDTIEEMMRDNGDGSVIVRLFSPRGSGRNRTYKPKYVRLSKSVVRNRGQDVYAQGALWVALVEKAFAIQTLDDFDDPPPRVDSTYKYIESGKATFAFEVLLGQPAGDTDLRTTIDLTSGVMLPWTRDALDVYEDVVKGDTTVASLPFHAEVFGRDRSKLDTWMTWLGQHDVAAMIRSHTSADDPDSRVRVEDFHAMFSAGALDAAVAADVIAWLLQARLVPGKRGTSHYTQQQLEAFEQIRTSLADGMLVTVSSKEKVGAGAGDVGGAGESKAKGLAGKHAYTVISCRQEQGSERRWVALRNPWGEYGRAYDFTAPKGQQARAVQGGGGRFELELSDLTKRFHLIRKTA
jgi:hypothetical protein